MMNRPQIDAEQEAVRSLMDLYEQAKKCQGLYGRARMGLPEPLQRFLGMSENGAKFPAVRPERNLAQVPPPERNNEPQEAGPEWICIAVADATPTSVALAVMRSAGGSIRSRDVSERVVELLPNVPHGSVANIGTRLDGILIQRGESGWQLTKPDSAGVIHEGFLWGPPSIFGKQELAAHRRDAILHILKHFSTGLQTIQLVEQLRNCAWVKAPVNKDLVKADMEVLQDKGKVRRRGNSKKWEAVRDEG